MGPRCSEAGGREKKKRMRDVVIEGEEWTRRRVAVQWRASEAEGSSLKWEIIGFS